MGMTIDNLCNSCTNIGCEFQSGIVRTKCAFYMPPHLEPDNCGNYVVQGSTPKNDLGVDVPDNSVRNIDCISRKAVLDAIDSKAWEFCDYLISKGRNDEQKPVSHFADNLREYVREEMSSVTPQLSSGLDKNSKKLEKDFGELDCISRQATVKRLCNLAEFMNEHKENSGDPYIMAALFIQDNKTEFPPVTPQEPKWISCSEKLPEYGEEVLTYSNVGGFIEIQSLKNSYGGYWENQRGDWSDLDEIIAWMPLPSAYKRGKEE